METLTMAGFVVDNAGFIVAAENKLEVVIQTYLLVNDHTIAKTRAWTAATTILPPLGGRDKRIPGVKT
jgi:hypothetical protein